MPSYVRAGIRKCARIRALSSGRMSSPWPVMVEPVPFAGEYPGEGAGGRVCRFLLRIHPTDERSLASCLCIKELIDGSNGLSWHPYAFVWRSSEGVRGNLRAGPNHMGRIALRDGSPERRQNNSDGAHTGNDTMGAAPVPASPSPSTRDEVARSESLPKPYRGPSRAIVAPQVRPPARPARENGGFPTPPQEKDRREE